MDKILLDVFFAGVRDDSYVNRDEKRVKRFVADLYLPGTGSFTIPVTEAVYGGLLNVPPMVTRYRLPIRLEVKNRVVKGEFGSYARAEMAVVYGDLEAVADQKKAS